MCDLQFKLKFSLCLGVATTKQDFQYQKSRWWMAYLAIPFFFLFPSVEKAEQFADIAVTPILISETVTSHGYCEYRFLVQNNSSTATHQVTLVVPDQSWDSHRGEISALRRTITLPPGGRAKVSIFQPPIPMSGNSQVRVQVNKTRVGTLPLPRRAEHAVRYSVLPPPPTVLCSRSLDPVFIESLFSHIANAFTPQMATGTPDSSWFRGSKPPTAWVPDGWPPHQITLVYEQPIKANSIRIYQTTPNLLAGGSITLYSATGNPVGTIPIPGSADSTNAPLVEEISIPSNIEPIKSLQIEFSANHGGIDAVELVGPTGNAWAVKATATEKGSSPKPKTALDWYSRASLFISDWSDHWLAYTPYDTILVKAADLGSAPDGVLDALWRYVECGGNLIVVGNTKIPEPWQSRARVDMPQFTEYTVGFGKCFVIRDKPLESLQQDMSWGWELYSVTQETSEFWNTLASSSDSSFKSEKDANVPLHTFMLALLVFVLVIGPLNFVILSYLKRRTWMLWTVPAISLLTSLLIFFYSIITEGTKPIIRTESVTILDQVNRRATVLASLSYYCPWAPRAGLKFSYDTELYPILAKVRRYLPGNKAQVDWTQGQHLVGGWVIARVPANFFVRKSEIRRERLQVEFKDGKLAVINGLGVPINSLWLVDAKGKVYSAGKIEPGARATLTDTQQTVPSNPLDLRSIFIKSGYGRITQSFTNAPSPHLRPGTYVAETEQNPFLEDGFPPYTKVINLPGRHIIFGILETPTNKS